MLERLPHREALQIADVSDFQAVFAGRPDEANPARAIWCTARSVTRFI
jgi:hypothetical protein